MPRSTKKACTPPCSSAAGSGRRPITMATTPRLPRCVPWRRCAARSPPRPCARAPSRAGPRGIAGDDGGGLEPASQGHCGRRAADALDGSNARLTAASTAWCFQAFNGSCHLLGYRRLCILNHVTSYQLTDADP
uniref:Uncharacterized protein n=1 Tax=Arundo donax TaxID=35708 RepID=A0A0A9AUQ7_ARUDO